MDNDIVLLRETLHNLTKRLEINDTIVGISQKYYMVIKKNMFGIGELQ